MRQTDFEKALNAIDMSQEDWDVEFAVDQVVEQFQDADFKALIPVIFDFFEQNPLFDAGAPGALVHVVENFWPDYADLLLQSVLSKPAKLTVLMVNRCLNDESLDKDLRQSYFQALKITGERSDISSEISAEAADFLAYQQEKLAKK